MTSRAVNNLEVTQEVQLGAYYDAAPVVSSAAAETLLEGPYSHFNMEEYNLNAALQREYLIGIYNWADSAAAGTALTTINFPGALFNQPFISEKLANFKFFKGGIRLFVRIASNRFLYGKLMVIFNPTNNIGKNIASTDLEYLSGFPHMLVSASSNEAAIFDLPFVSQYRALDMANYQTGEMGGVKIVVLNPLTDVQGNAATVQVCVFAQFLDAKLMLPMDYIPTSNPKVESRNKSAKGIISGTLEAAQPLASALERIPFVAPYATTFKRLSKPASSFAKMLGLNKPTTTAVTQVGKINPFVDLSSGKGLDLAPKLAMDPENQISTMCNMAGMAHDEMDLVTLAGTPMFTTAMTMTNATGAQFLTYLAPVYGGGNDYPTYVDFVAQNFNWVSGSLKFKFYITASLFHSARFVFWLTNDSVTGGNWENCYHQVVDIQGDSEVDMTVAYPAKEVVWDYNNTNANSWCIWVKALSWSEPDPVVAAPIFINVYKAGDSDIRFYGLKEMRYAASSETWIATSNPRADFAKPFQPLHPTFTGYSQNGFVCGEEYKSVRDIVHRYHAKRSPALGGTVSVYEGGGSLGTKSYIGVELWGLVYKYWRGSIRMKHMQKDGTMGCTYMTYNGVTNFVGPALSCSTNPVIEYEAPYYDNRLMLPTTDASPITVKSSSVYARYIMSAAGDDFSFHFITPPPPGYITTVPGTQGLQGLFAYINA